MLYFDISQNLYLTCQWRHYSRLLWRVVCTGIEKSV